MAFSINLGGWNSVFAVPSEVVDKHIKLAGSAQLKVLLWLLRHAGEPVDEGAIAQSLSMHPADVRDAMQYWIACGLISEQGGTLTPSQDPTAPAQPAQEVPAAGNTASAPAVAEPQA